MREVLGKVLREVLGHVLEEVLGEFLREIFENVWGSSWEKFNRNCFKILFNRRLCIEDGTWSQDAPVCREITCDEPDVSENLIVESGTRLVGSMAKYSCPKGHYIVGNDTRKCIISGQWTGRSPKCRGKYTGTSEIARQEF